MHMLAMPIVLIIIGVVLVAFSDKLQFDGHRKPKLNIYLGSLGGIVWFAGVILAFVNYKLLHASLLLIASLMLAAIVGVRK